MEQLLIRQIEPRIKQALKDRAKRHGCSMEEEARSILRDALARKEESVNLGNWLTQNMKGVDFDPAIFEFDWGMPQPVIFDEE